MPKIDYYTAVDADLQTIWSVLLDRIEHPDRYLAEVESFRFVESTEDYAIRETVIRGTAIQEKITIDERQGEVRYQLLNDPLFTGDVYNALIPPAENDPQAKPVVQFRMDWQPLNEDAQRLEVEGSELLEESLKQAVHYVKDLAEHMQRQKI